MIIALSLMRDGDGLRIFLSDGRVGIGIGVLRVVVVLTRVVDHDLHQKDISNFPPKVFLVRFGPSFGSSHVVSSSLVGSIFLPGSHMLDRGVLSVRSCPTSLS